MASPAVVLEPPPLPRSALDAARTTSEVLADGAAEGPPASAVGPEDGVADGIGDAVGAEEPAGAPAPAAWVPDFCVVFDAAPVEAVVVPGAGAPCFASHAWYPVALSHSVHGIDWPSA